MGRMIVSAAGGNISSAQPAPGRSRGEIFADELLEWNHTPFVWQQSVKGLKGGCDCRGLMSGAARECGFPEAGSLYATMASYAKKAPVPCDLLFEGMCSLFDLIPFERQHPRASGRAAKFAVPRELQRGDILLVAMRGRAQHLAGVTSTGPDGRAMHAQIGSKNWVKETRLDVLLRMYPLHSIFRWREMEA